MNETTDRTTASDAEFRSRVARFEDGGNRERAAEVRCKRGFTDAEHWQDGHYACPGFANVDPIAAAEARGRAEGAADELGSIVRWARFRCGSLTVDALHRECLARAAEFRALLADLPTPASEAGDAR